MNKVVKTLYHLFLNGRYTVANTEQIDFVWIISYHTRGLGDNVYFVKPFATLLAHRRNIGWCQRAEDETVIDRDYDRTGYFKDCLTFTLVSFYVF